MNRALHVYSEAQRVFQFRDAKTLQVADTTWATPTHAPQELGQLMNESHESCSKQFECSCPELDELTALCRYVHCESITSCSCYYSASGALGSRLTGAGWGGCAVSLVPEAKVAEFLKAVEAGYYAKDPAKVRCCIDYILLAD